MHRESGLVSDVSVGGIFAVLVERLTITGFVFYRAKFFPIGVAQSRSRVNHTLDAIPLQISEREAAALLHPQLRPTKTGRQKQGWCCIRVL